MDTGRNTGSEGRSAAPRQHEEVGAAGHRGRTDSERERHRSSDSRSADEIQQDIRRTRAEMTETIDELEYRLSPDRLKREAKGAMHETIDEVKYRMHPQRIAERAGRTMLDTVRDHPLPSLIAGLSIGYLLMKSGERTSERGDDYNYRSRRYARGSQGIYEPAHYRERGYAESGYRRADYGSQEEEGRSMSEQASETAEQMQERAQEMGHRMQERVSETGHRMQHRARHARGGMEDFITENPLAAGAIALGVGALLGSTMPHTRTEDEWMGPMRDDAADRAEAAAREGMRRAQEAPGHIAQKAAEAAGEVGEKAKSEAQEVTEAAKSEAKDVAEGAAKGAKEKNKE